MVCVGFKYHRGIAYIFVNRIFMQTWMWRGRVCEQAQSSRCSLSVQVCEVKTRDRACLHSPAILSLAAHISVQSLNTASLKMCHCHRNFLSSESLCNLHFWEAGTLAGEKENVFQPPLSFCPLLLLQAGWYGQRLFGCVCVYWGISTNSSWFTPAKNLRVKCFKDRQRFYLWKKLEGNLSCVSTPAICPDLPVRKTATESTNV